MMHPRLAHLGVLPQGLPGRALVHAGCLQGRPHTLSGRCHGDPFPLPVFGGGAGEQPRLTT